MSQKPHPQLSVVIPAYNEAARIGKTLEIVDAFLRQQQLSYEILVVDDGSRDQTKAVVEKLSLPHLRVVAYGENRGKGYAVHYGVSQATGGWILFTDADNSTPIEEYTRLFSHHEQFEVIIGSRYLPESNIAVKQPTPRVILSRLGNLLVQLLVLPGVKDTQCGFKLFSAKAAKAIFAKQTIFGWGFDIELLRIAKEQGFAIKEVPVSWYNDTQSRIQSSRVFTRTLRELLAIKRNSLAGRYRSNNTEGKARSEASYVIRFGLVGAIGTALDFAVLNLCYAGLGLNLYVAITAGFLSGAVNNYLLNSLWSFQQALSWRKFRSFLAIAVIGLLINYGILFVFTERLHWNFNVSKALAVAVVFVWNYALNRKITFI